MPKLACNHLEMHQHIKYKQQQSESGSVFMIITLIGMSYYQTACKINLHLIQCYYSKGLQIYIHIHTHIHTYTYTYKYIYIHIHTHIHIYIIIYIHTYIHIYIHTYLHTYIHYPEGHWLRSWGGATSPH